MKSLPWLRIVCSLLAGGLAFFILSNVPWSFPRAVIPNCLDSEFEFTPDSRSLVVWSGSKVLLSSTLHMNESGIHVHDVATGERRCTFEKSKELIFLSRVTLSPDSQSAVGWRGLAEVFTWDITTGRKTQSPAIELEGSVPTFFFAPDAELLFTNNHDRHQGMTRRLSDGKLIADYRSLVEDAKLLESHVGLLSAYITAREVRVIDRVTGKLVHVFPLPGGKRFENFKLWANGNILTAHEGVSTRAWYIWPAPGAEPTPLEHVAYPNAFHISADGQWLAGSRPVPQSPWLDRMMEKWLRRHLPNSALHIVRREDGGEMGSIRDGVDARISPDGRTLSVSCNDDGRLELWDFPLRKPTLLVGLLSVLTALIVYQSVRWWQNRRRKPQLAIASRETVAETKP